jgi:hypothetical protein
VLRGGVGNERIFGQTEGNDEIYGQAGDDEIDDHSEHRVNSQFVGDLNIISGGGGQDLIYGNYKLSGGSGDDELHANTIYQDKGKPTTLRGGSGTDELRGDFRDGTIYAQDGERDIISCGGGTDTVYFDKGIDSISPIGCEKRISGPQ